MSEDKQNKAWRRTTGLVIVAGSGLVVAYDILALVFGGEDATISAVINDGAYVGPVLPFAMGAVIVGLLVHFFGWSPRKDQ